MSHEHQPHGHGHHGHEHGHHHGHGDPHHQNFFEMEDILQRDFKLKEEKLVGFLKKTGLKEGQRVLEIGCGFAPLLELYCDVVGPGGSVTLTDPESRLADRLAPRLAGRPNARFVAARAEDLATLDGGGESEGYDLAVMVNVYHHLTDPELVLSALHRSLRVRSGRLVVFDFIHDTFRLFASPSATPAAAAAQARLAEVARPVASPVTALCATRLEAHGFSVRLSDCYVLQDRFNRSELGDFYAEFMLRGLATDVGRQAVFAACLPALREDPDCVLLSEVQVMLAADAV